MLRLRSPGRTSAAYGGRGSGRCQDGQQQQHRQPPVPARDSAALRAGNGAAASFRRSGADTDDEKTRRHLVRLQVKDARGHFPTEQAALKCVYLAIMSLDPTGQGRRRWAMRSKPALNAFEMTFEGRLSPSRG